MEIIEKHVSKYEVGDVVIFRKNNHLEVGIIEGGYVDDGTFWFNIRINKNEVYTYSNKGDVAESDIIGKTQNELIDIIKRTMEGSI